jgi:hypothetical protein
MCQIGFDAKLGCVLKIKIKSLDIELNNNLVDSICM